MMTNHAFSGDQRAAVYHCIEARRDVRSEFLPTPIPQDVLARLLMAAHHAPSVGFMQPWDFIVIQSQTVKRSIHAAFAKANEEAAGMFDDTRAVQYQALKLQGILEAPLGLCITCDRDRAGPVVLGRTHQPEMDLYSTVCAVQNFWLAARSEGIGVGWVSIIAPDDLRACLGIPPQIVPIAYLCVGYVSHFHESPELEAKGWRQREQLQGLIHFDRWDNRPKAHSLLKEHLKNEPRKLS